MNKKTVGLQRPKLTHYLSKILSRYPLGGQILKVIICILNKQYNH